MIELIIAFLISIGWCSPKALVSIKNEGNGRFGIVTTDDGYPKSATVVYDSQLGIFRVEN